MKYFRQIGLFSLVAIALAGCGTAASAQDVTSSSPTVSPVATGSQPAATPPQCPTAPAYQTQFCMTPAEEADGQTVVHDPTIPDTGLIAQGITLTIGPDDTASITQAQAEQAVTNYLSTLAPGGASLPAINSAVLAEVHNEDGLPTVGQLVWVVDISPPGGAFEPLGGPAGSNHPTGPAAITVPYQEYFVDATTGQVLYGSSGQ